MNLKSTFRPIPACLLLSAALILTAVPGCAQEGDAASEPAAIADGQEMSEDSKTFYALGVVLGQNLSAFSLTDAELASVQQGLADSAQGNEPKVELEVYGPKLQGLAQARMAAAAAKEKADGKSFLDGEAAKEGAVKYDSGLVVIETAPGEGDSPSATDTVTVHYHGTLRDGTVFDSSVDRDEPATFPLDRVIKCWTEGVQKMKVGGKSRLVCPSDIAYGDQGRPPGIPGGATLIFDVELISIEAPATPPADS